MIAVEVATPFDFKRYFRQDPPEIFTALVGKDANGRMLGMGGVVYDEWGRAFGFFDSRIRPTFALHRAAVRFFKALREVGEPAVYAFCERDENPRAAAWMQRLGFKPTDEFKDVPGDLWKWTP